MNVATGATLERTGTATSGPVSGCESVFPSGTATSATFRPADEPCGQLVGGSSGSSGLCGFADIAGTITAANLTGPLAGRSMSDLVAAIRAGNIYINLHTRQFPGGEIRGQLMDSSTGSTSTDTTQTTDSTGTPDYSTS